MKISIIISVLVTQIALWISYYVFFTQHDLNFASLWGNTPSQTHIPLLVIASIAYIMNIYLLVSMAMYRNLSESDEWLIVGCILAYYVAQLLFLPLTNLAVNKKIPKCVVTSLLIFCVIPLAIVAGVVTKYTYNSDMDGSLVKLVTAFVPLMHVLIDDAILFGFLF